MGKRSTGSRSESRPEWEQLEEEVTEFLGKAKSARRSESDSPERIRQTPEAYAEFGNDTAEEATSLQHQGGVREPATQLGTPLCATA